MVSLGSSTPPVYAGFSEGGRVLQGLGHGGFREERQVLPTFCDAIFTPVAPARPPLSQLQGEISFGLALQKECFFYLIPSQDLGTRDWWLEEMV